MHVFLRFVLFWSWAYRIVAASSFTQIEPSSQSLCTDTRKNQFLKRTQPISLSPSEVARAHVKRTPPAWKFEDQFEFYGFWLSNEMNIARRAFIGIIDLLAVTMKILGGNPWDSKPPGITDPSFLRYFNPGDLNTFGAVLQTILAVLGAPNTDAIRQCIEATKLQLIYGDGKGGGRRCISDTSGVYAYYNAYTDNSGNIRSYLSFCPRFFANFRSYDEVQKDNLGKSIDIADPTTFSEAETGTAIALHEMETDLQAELLHWLDPLRAVLPKQIEDLKIVRPDDKSQRTAYRSFYAMHVKDWSGGQSPLQNADSYVFCVLEIFYRNHFSLPYWEDSPDPYAPMEGPDGGP